MISVQVVEALKSYDNTLGAAFIGFTCSTLLLGILLAQVYRYYSRFPRDKAGYKILVGMMSLVVLADQAFISHAMYHYSVTDYGNPISLPREPVIWSLIIQIFLGSFVGATVKFCFALRVWRFSHRNFLVTSTIVILTLAQFGFATAYSVTGFQHSSVSLIAAVALPSEKLLATLALSFGCTTDIITAAALSFYLGRLRTGYRKSDNVVTRLTMYAVSTGIVTSAASFATLVLYNCLPDNFIFMGVYFVVSKLYAISFLAALNTRTILSGRGTDNQPSTKVEFSLQQRGGPGTPGSHPGMLPAGAKPSPSQSFQIGMPEDLSVVSEIPDLPDYKLPAFGV